MYLLFEVGGTNTRIGFSPDGINLENSEIIPSLKNFDEFIGILKEKSRGELQGIGGGIPGVLDADRNNILQCPHLKNWIGQKAKEKLEQAFNTKVVLDNETSMAALGEATLGAGKGYPIVGYVAVGTGVGGARVVEGKPDKKALGFEIGHQIIVKDGDLCACGGKGHLEAYVGGAYIQKIYQQNGEDIKDQKIWEEITRYFAIGLYNISTHWSPHVFVLGGSVIQSIDLNLLEKYLKEYSTIFPQIPDIKLATLGHQNGLLGALHAITQIS